ncbi:SusC/RagA family TonB-linked outer membrane protein [Hymenobacter cavernae]|uniref:SusC/RagA family TonB-linked outer membrane protein n=1 Tax=Hymenobacter cavernae TaxID=2044852 RepID=A0ABQ1U1G7_9BACT|nr:TonB-dependent receptor [Hymenobacter cavernae]GGF08423.1 SusC/RagA family TonB-linked outer membrane protein [Hymenobacter cavernae]
MNKRIPTTAHSPQKWSRRVILLLTVGLAPNLGWAQEAAPHAVSGRITADNGEALAGVAVTLKGTDAGTTTDANGRYTLTVPDDHSVLVICAVGYACRELPARRAGASHTLSPETQPLPTRQLVGYGTQVKSQVTGAIATVGDEQLHDVPVANSGQALQGRTPGVSVASASTAPGQNPVIRIRGNRSFSGGSDPLLVVDGVPFEGNLNDLNPDDITSVEALRDAAATAIYGGRGANGILLLTTRRGKEGAPQVSYSGYYGIKSTYGRYDLQNGQQYYNYRAEAYRAAGWDPNKVSNFLTTDERANYAAGRTTDYQSLLFQHGHLQNHNLGVSGGTVQTKYSVALGYYDETGIVPVQRFRRYSLRGTLDQQIGKRVNVGFSTLTASLRDDDPTANVLYNILTTSPLASPTDASGNPVLFPNGDQAGANPLTLYVPDAHRDERRRLRSFNSLYGQVNILKGLDYRANVGLDFRSEKGNSFYAANTPQRGGGRNAASRSTNEVFNLLLENVLTYSRTLGRHYFHATGLYSWQQSRAESTSAAATGVPNGAMGNPSLGSGGSQQWNITSLMSRLHYAYADRYSATFTYRNDGSSRLSPGSKHSGFFGAAAAWNLAQERFLMDHSWVSLLKLRASTGRVSSAVVSPYQTLGSLGSGSGGYYNYGSTGAVGVVPSGIPNLNLGWEYTTTLNGGLDFGLFQNRVTGSLDVYRQRSTDLLLSDALPSNSGYSSYVRSGGQVENRGLEFALTTVNVRTGRLSGFAWSTEWNFTVNREKVLDLGLRDANGNKISDIGNQRFLGQPLYAIYDYKKLGIWQTAEADQARRYGSKPGQVKVADVDGNGIINPADRQVIGAHQPRFEAGLTNRFRYKGFDLSVVALTRVGTTVADPVLFGPNYFTTNTGRRNQLNLNYWTPTNPSNDYPQPDQSSRSNEWPTYSSTLAYRDGTFIKVRSLDLGYTIPATWAGALHLTSARVYVQVQNPLIWTRDSYFRANKAIDPDALSYSYSTHFYTAGAAGAGGNYPVTRAFLAGVHLGF